MKTFEAWWNFKKKQIPLERPNIEEPIDPYSEEIWDEIDKLEVIKTHLFKKPMPEQRKLKHNHEWYIEMNEIILQTESNNYFIVGDIRHSFGGFFMAYFHYRNFPREITNMDNLEPLTDAEFQSFSTYLSEHDHTGNLRIDIDRDVTYLDILYDKFKEE